MLLGKVARAIGVENWNRRYVWGLEDAKSDGAMVVIALGFSVTIYAKDKMDRARLNEVVCPPDHPIVSLLLIGPAQEHTFWDSEVSAPTRPCQLEAIEKRSYYLVDAHVVPNPDDEHKTDVVVLRHVNEDGETFDIVWDAREPRRPANNQSGLGGVFSRVSSGVGRLRRAVPSQV